MTIVTSVTSWHVTCARANILNISVFLSDISGDRLAAGHKYKILSACSVSAPASYLQLGEDWLGTIEILYTCGTRGRVPRATKQPGCRQPSIWRSASAIWRMLRAPALNHPRPRLRYIYYLSATIYCDHWPAAAERSGGGCVHYGQAAIIQPPY